MTRIEISIIIPVYNVEKYLKKCLDSILEQTFQDFEIICVDDGSTDKSLKILQDYKKRDDRFVILQQRHSGAGAARNHGIKLAEGKYIQLLDADDYFEPTLLEELYNHAEKYNADLVVCSARKVDSSENITESGNPLWPINIDKVPLEQPFCWKDFPEDIFNLFCVIPWNKLYLKKLITDNNLFFQNIPSSNDLGFSHLARICAKKIVVFNKELINYRYNREGSIAEYRADNTINIIEAFLFIESYLKNKNIYTYLKEGLTKAFINHIRAGISHCNENQYKKFLQEFKNLMPNDWQKFKSALRKDYITPEYLEKFIGDKKVVLWGASLFIKQVLEKEKVKNPNILGIIDRNAASAGKQFCNYTIFPPESIKDLKPDGVILTVLSNNESIYPSLKQELQEKYPEAKLLPNIFDEETYVEQQCIL